MGYLSEVVLPEHQDPEILVGRGELLLSLCDWLLLPGQNESGCQYAISLCIFFKIKGPDVVREERLEFLLFRLDEVQLVGET